MVGAAVRFLESEGGVEGGADSQHPVVLVMQLCWEALDASIAKVCVCVCVCVCVRSLHMLCSVWTLSACVMHPRPG